MTSNRELINSMIAHQKETLVELRVLMNQMVFPTEVYEELRNNILSNIAGLEHLRGQIPNGEVD
jgi:hypothetical protein